MSKKIYVGNLNYDTTEEKLNSLFSQHGEIISVKAISDKFTGKSKGFAFVEMANDAEAKAAIAALNGQEVDGRTIKVNEALDKPRDKSYGDRRY
jgi:RNA recognition motif-containing protein